MRSIQWYCTVVVRYLLQGQDLLLVLLVSSLGLVEQTLPLLVQAMDLLPQTDLLTVQVPDSGLVTHLSGLQGADLTCLTHTHTHEAHTRGTHTPTHSLIWCHTFNC